MSTIILALTMFLTSNPSAAKVSPRMSRGDRVALEEARNYIDNHDGLKNNLLAGFTTTDDGDEILVCGEVRCLCTGKKSCNQIKVICGEPQHDGFGYVKCTK